jgi:hypothetical protein
MFNRNLSERTHRASTIRLTANRDPSSPQPAPGRSGPKIGRWGTPVNPLRPISQQHRRIASVKDLGRWSLGLGLGIALIGLGNPAQSQPQQASQRLGPDSPELPRIVQQALEQAIAQSTTQPLESLRIDDAQTDIWPDGCLGLGEPNETCTQGRISGWLVLATDGRQSWLYRTNANGRLLRPDPRGLARLLGNGQGRQAINPATPTSNAPRPEERQLPDARVAPSNQGLITITLINRINSGITFEVIDDTNQRRLAGDRVTQLSNLPLPITLTLHREDGGLLRILPRQQGPAHSLEVYLDAEIDLGQDRSTITIERDGAVFLN